MRKYYLTGRFLPLIPHLVLAFALLMACSLCLPLPIALAEQAGSEYLDQAARHNFVDAQFQLGKLYRTASRELAPGNN